MILSKSCEKKSSHHRLHNQKHRVHAPLVSKSKSQKKRKFDWYIYDDIFTINFELVDREKYDSEYAKDQRRCLSSPHSRSTLADKKHAILQRTKEHVFPTLDDKEYCGINMEDYSQLLESEDSINGSSYPMHQGSLKIQHRDLTGSSSSSNFFLSTKTPLKDKPSIEFVETLEDKSVDEDFTDGKPSSKTTKDLELVCSFNKYLPARGNHLPRPIIPIGPMFQAEVPNWEGSIGIKQHNDDYGLKWFGTQIWPIPIPIISETNTSDI